MAFIVLTAIEDVRDDPKSDVPFVILGKIIVNPKYITKVIPGIFMDEKERNFLHLRTNMRVDNRSSFVCIKDDTSSPLHVIENVDTIYKKLTTSKKEENDVT